MASPIFVIDVRGQPLIPVAPAYARKLLAGGRAEQVPHSTLTIIRLNRQVDQPKVRPVLVGLHPQLAHERKNELRLFTQLLPYVRYIGEVGLDGSPELKQHWSDQIFVFRSILQNCQEAGGKVLSIHSRRAASAVLDHLEQYIGAGTSVLHWFSGINPPC